MLSQAYWDEAREVFVGDRAWRRGFHNGNAKLEVVRLFETIEVALLAPYIQFHEPCEPKRQSQAVDCMHDRPPEHFALHGKSTECRITGP